MKLSRFRYHPTSSNSTTDMFSKLFSFGSKKKPTKKEFKLSAADIKPLVDVKGFCMATDMITREGLGVNFMYRELIGNLDDSGWRFLSGYEDDEYTNDPSNLNLYSVNTIANYQPDIIPFLTAPFGSAFKRNQQTGEIEEVFDFEMPDNEMERNFKVDGFVLQNGYQIHLAHPETFWIPEDEIRKNLQRGWLAKLMFKFKTVDLETNFEDHFVERMWVVVGTKEQDSYSGFLNNQPFCTNEIMLGKKITFAQEHVIDYLIPTEDEWNDYNQFAIDCEAELIKNQSKKSDYRSVI